MDLGFLDRTEPALAKGDQRTRIAGFLPAVFALRLFDGLGTNEQHAERGLATKCLALLLGGFVFAFLHLRSLFLV